MIRLDYSHCEKGGEFLAYALDTNELLVSGGSCDELVIIQAWGRLDLETIRLPMKSCVTTHQNVGLPVA